MGPHLYDGTSGVALFMAEGAVRFRDDRMRDTAIGAIRHALQHARRLDGNGLGLYTGPIGVAYAAARVGQLLEAEEALAGAHELLLAWRRHPVPSADCDLVDGRAGALTGLLALAPLVEESWLVEAAVGLGEELMARAAVSRLGWSWPAPGQRAMHNLCGFAHGAAGIGLALVELFGATGDKRFRRAAEGAFAYVRSWMRPETGVWPDLRGVARVAGREAPAPVSTSWCHGAPGIALSRLRAAGLLRADQPRAEPAVMATRRITCELLAYCPDDFCLCHGAAGAADVLVYAADSSGLAEEVGLLGVEQFHRREKSFPCGLPGGQTPGLMLGLAGVAAFYLRLADRSVPSPLVIQPRGDLDGTPKPA